MQFQSTRPRGARLVCISAVFKAEYFNPRAHAGRDPESGNPLVALGDFNPRAHAGRDSAGSWIFHAFRLFQSTRPRGARHSIKNVNCPWGIFQSTRPRGARHSTRPTSIIGSVFQSTRPRGARPPKGEEDHLPDRFQSTRPRGARPEAQIKVGRIDWISIHAPTRGATSNYGVRRGGFCISIHAPTRGATQGRHTGPADRIHFNPRAHAGRDAITSTTPRIGDIFQSTRPRGARQLILQPLPTLSLGDVIRETQINLGKTFLSEDHEKSLTYKIRPLRSARTARHFCNSLEFALQN